jgi:hypothetical protein
MSTTAGANGAMARRRLNPLTSHQTTLSRRTAGCGCRIFGSRAWRRHRQRDVVVAMSLLYWALRRLLELIVLRGRGGAGNEIELLVLRHQVAVLRRHAGRPRFHPADRAVFAALARFLPSERSPSLPVSPATARRWHRDAVARRWTHPRRTPGRPPPVDRPLRELIVRLARENPTWGYRLIQGEIALLGTRLSSAPARSSVRRGGPAVPGHPVSCPAGTASTATGVCYA